MKRIAITAAVALIVAVSNPAPAKGEGCTGGASAAGNVFIGSGQCSSGGSESGAGQSQTEAASSDSYSAYRWKLACSIAVGTAYTCAFDCPDGQLPYQLLGLANGTWYPLDVKCSADGPPDNQPTVTPALVARAFQRIPLPKLRAITQPADKTLINFDTIFYVEAQPLHRSLRLLGQRVELEITPSTFRWVHGDGTAAVTHTPGAAYPAKDVVYRYQQAHVTVSHHVEITWTARWSLNGGPYQDVDGTVTTVGPDTPLRVAEATPALSGFGH